MASFIESSKLQIHPHLFPAVPHLENSFPDMLGQRHKDAGTKMFAAALLEGVKLGTNPKCPSLVMSEIDRGPSVRQETSRQITPICLHHGNSLKPSTVLSAICISLVTVYFGSETLDHSLSQKEALCML